MEEEKRKYEILNQRREKKEADVEMKDQNTVMDNDEGSPFKKETFERKEEGVKINVGANEETKEDE